MNPQVSVIVPVYNMENYLSNCINSILDQTFSDFELILVNDGSQDSSNEICNEFARKDNRIIVIHKKNEGVSSARNTGLNKAIGKYVCFVDSDDTVDNDYIEKMYQLAVDNNADLTICGLKMFSNGKQTDFGSDNFGLYKIDNFKMLFLDLLKSSYLNFVFSKLYKSEMIKNEVYFDQSIDIGEDTLFILKVLNKIQRVYISNDKPYNYYLHGTTTLTHKFRKNKYQILLSTHKKIEDVANKWNLNNPEHYQILIQRYFDFTIPCIMSINMSTHYLTINQKLQYINDIYTDKIYQSNFKYINKINLRVSKKLEKIIKTKCSILLLLYLEISNLKNRVSNKIDC